MSVMNDFRILKLHGKYKVGMFYEYNEPFSISWYKDYDKDAFKKEEIERNWFTGSFCSVSTFYMCRKRVIKLNCWHKLPSTNHIDKVYVFWKHLRKRKT